MTTFGPGRMAKAIAAFDWSTTSLGPIEIWPVSLVSVVRMMIGQKQAISIFWGEELVMLYNDAYAPTLGLREPGALGQPFRDIWSDIWDEVTPFVDRALSGEGTFSEELPLTMTRNGFDEETFWTFSYSPVYDDAGKIAGLINVAMDATPAVISRRQQQVMQRELVHRVKNSLAVATAVVSSTLRTARTLDEARDTIATRIAALARAQDLLGENADGAEVRRIVASTIHAHVDHPDRLAMTGPALTVAPAQAIGLSMAVYELATNAVKYGALSNATGRISVEWGRASDGAFSFVWRERGGPPVDMPRRKGFGSRLTNTMVAAQFAGKGETRYDREGLTFMLSGKIP